MVTCGRKEEATDLKNQSFSPINSVGRVEKDPPPMVPLPSRQKRCLVLWRKSSNYVFVSWQISEKKKICLPRSRSRAIRDISGARLIRIYLDGGEQHSYAWTTPLKVDSPPTNPSSMGPTRIKCSAYFPKKDCGFMTRTKTTSLCKYKCFVLNRKFWEGRRT